MVVVTNRQNCMRISEIEKEGMLTTATAEVDVSDTPHFGALVSRQLVLVVSLETGQREDLKAKRYVFI